MVPDKLIEPQNNVTTLDLDLWEWPVILRAFSLIYKCLQPKNVIQTEKPKNIRTKWDAADMVHGYNVIAINQNLKCPSFLGTFG